MGTSTVPYASVYKALTETTLWEYLLSRMRYITITCRDVTNVAENTESKQETSNLCGIVVNTYQFYSILICNMFSLNLLDSCMDTKNI